MILCRIGNFVLACSIVVILPCSHNVIYQQQTPPKKKTKKKKNHSNKHIKTHTDTHMILGVCFKNIPALDYNVNKEVDFEDPNTHRKSGSLNISWSYLLT